MGTEQYKVRVVVEGDTTGFQVSADKARLAADKLSEAAMRAGASVTNFKAASDKAGGQARTLGDALRHLKEKNKGASDSTKDTSGSLKGFGEAAKKTAQPIQGMVRNMSSLKFETANFGRGMLDAVKVLGPWGAAIGIAGEGLVSLMAHMDAANEKARAFAQARKEEQRLLAEQNRADFIELTNSRRVDEATSGISAHIRVLEMNRSVLQGLGKDTNALTVAIMQLEAARLRASKVGTYGLGEDAQQAEFARLDREAANVEHQAVLVGLESSVRRKKSGGKRPTRQSDEFNQALMEARGNIIQRDGSDSREFAEALAEARAAERKAEAIEAMRRRAPGGDRGALDERMRQIEISRARQPEAFDPVGELTGTKQADHDAELARIEEMRTAKMTFFQEELAAATTSDEQAAIREEMRQTNHEAELARINEEIAAQQEHAMRVQQFTAMGAAAANTAAAGILSVTDARRGAINAAKAQGKTDREAARAGKIAALEATAGQLQALRNLAITKAIEQTALGIGALAVFNYPSAGLHFAAAATWGAVGVGAGIGARAVASRATGMQRSDSQAANSGGVGRGAGAGGGGGGGGSSANDSPIPGSPRSGPGPRAPTTGGSRPSGNTVIQLNINGDVVGTPRREFVRELDQQLSELGQSRRRRAGGD